MQPQQEINAIDVNLAGKVDSKGVANRDPGQSYEQFFNDVFNNEKVIGFEWKNNELGIILGN